MGYVADEAGERFANLKFRRHFKLVALLMLIAAVLILGFGDQRIIAYSVPRGEQAAETGTIADNQVTLSDDAAASSAEGLVYDTDWLELVAH